MAGGAALWADRQSRGSDLALGAGQRLMVILLLWARRHRVGLR